MYNISSTQWPKFVDLRDRAFLWSGDIIFVSCVSGRRTSGACIFFQAASTFLSRLALALSIGYRARTAVGRGGSSISKLGWGGRGLKLISVLDNLFFLFRYFARSGSCKLRKSFPCCLRVYICFNCFPEREVLRRVAV